MNWQIPNPVISELAEKFQQEKNTNFAGYEASQIIECASSYTDSISIRGIKTKNPIDFR